MDYWHWPQYTYVTMMALNLITNAFVDGQPKTGKHSFAITVCACGISIWILYSGGFF